MMGLFYFLALGVLHGGPQLMTSPKIKKNNNNKLENSDLEITGDWYCT